MEWSDFAMWGVYGLAVYGGLVGVKRLTSRGKKKLHPNTIARIYLRGQIKDQAPQRSPFSQGREITTDAVKELVDHALDDGVKGIIFDINSPGGSPVASDEIGSLITKLEIPTVARVRGMAASGGYWIAASCDYIVANRNSLVGSIGVIASHTNIEGLLDMFDIKKTTFKAGKYKDMLSPFREPTDEEKTIFGDSMDELHNDFKDTIAEYRKIPREEVDKVAEGLVYSGKKALEYKLIDELGGEDEAKAFIEKELGTTDTEIKNYETRRKFSLPSLFRTGVYHMGNSFAKGFSTGIKETVSEELQKRNLDMR